MGTTRDDGSDQPPSSNRSPSQPDAERDASTAWDSWEVFDPRDGRTTHFTDGERTAEQIAVEEEQLTGEPRDYGRRGMEPDGRGGWRPWHRPVACRAHRQPPPEADLIEDDEVDLPPPDRNRAPDMGRAL
jgi:hypothetical protein